MVEQGDGVMVRWVSVGWSLTYLVLEKLKLVKPVLGSGGDVQVSHCTCTHMLPLLIFWSEVNSVSPPHAFISHPHFSPPHPPTPSPPSTHGCASTPAALRLVLLVLLKLFLQRMYLQTSNQQWCVQHRQTDRQTEGTCLHISPHRLLMLCHLGLLHTCNEGHDTCTHIYKYAHTHTHTHTHTPSGCLANPKPHPIHTRYIPPNKQHTERVQLQYVQILLSLPTLGSLSLASPHSVTAGRFHGVHWSHKLVL